MMSGSKAPDYFRPFDPGIINIKCGRRNKMKKNELAKKSRKLLSAILTGTVLITSVVPESLIWAADVEMQEFEDGEDNEDVIFEAAEEPAEEPETEDVEESGEVEIQDLSESQESTL